MKTFIQTILIIFVVLIFMFGKVNSQNSDNSNNDSKTKPLENSYEDLIKLEKLLIEYHEALIQTEKDIRDNNNINNTKELTENYDKLRYYSRSVPHGLKYLSSSINDLIIKNSNLSKILVSYLTKEYIEFDTDKENQSILYWYEMINYLFHFDNKSSLLFGFKLIDELKLDYNAGTYIIQLENYSVGPLMAQMAVYPEIKLYNLKLYKRVNLLMDTSAFKDIIPIIIANIYMRVKDREIFGEATYECYIDLLKKYIDIPKDLLDMIPNYDVNYDVEFRKSFKKFFRTLFDRFNSAKWDLKKRKYIIEDCLQTQPQTQDND